MVLAKMDGWMDIIYHRVLVAAKGIGVGADHQIPTDSVKSWIKCTLDVPPSHPCFLSWEKPLAHFGYPVVTLGKLLGIISNSGLVIIKNYQEFLGNLLVIPEKSWKFIDNY